MTIEELKKKIEAIDVLDGEAKLTICVNPEDYIDVIVCIGNKEQKMLTIESTEDGVLFLDIEDYLYTTDAVSVFINVLQVCHEYMESTSAEGELEDINER